MEFCGIVCEFNPFHNGHKFLIDQIKQNYKFDLVCIMSGNFVQRGIPAIEEKYNRAKKAIEANADMVVELPCIYACSNAENFAFGAIKTLAALDITHLAFGIENSSLETLDKIAELKVKNSIEFQNAFKNEIQNGINYNTSLKRSIANTIKEENIIDILNKPNNILAIEYLYAIKKLNLKIIPIAINRTDNGFFDKQSKNEFLSATAIRERLFNNENINKFVPGFAKIENYFSKTENEIYEKFIIHKIRSTPASVLEKLYDYNEGIEYRIKEKANQYSNLNDIINAVATPRYRIARINKLLLYPLLNITKDIQMKASKSKPVCKLLAINKNKKYLLSQIKKSKVNLISTNKEYLTLTKTQKEIIDIDLNASNIYNLIMSNINNNDKKIGTIFK